jgi:hypothetical protein
VGVVFYPSISAIPYQKSLNSTMGHKTYILTTNESGNLEMLLVTSNAHNKNISYKLTKDSGDNGSDNNSWLKDYLVPISVALIGGVAASWGFIQARWNGRYFQKLIIEELGEFEPDLREEQRQTLPSYNKKEFIHRVILGKPTENKEFIFNTNHHLIYLTKQLWNAFDHNDVEQFLLYFCYIAEERRRFWKFEMKKDRWIFKMKKYDKHDRIKNAYKQWIVLVTNEDKRKNKNIEIRDGEIRKDGEIISGENPIPDDLIPSNCKVKDIKQQFVDNLHSSSSPTPQDVE